MGDTGSVKVGLKGWLGPIGYLMPRRNGSPDSHDAIALLETRHEKIEEL
jgi:hypothetical protein